MKENKRPRPQPQFVEEPDSGHTETLTEEEKRQKVKPFCSIYMYMMTDLYMCVSTCRLLKLIATWHHYNT